MSLAEDLIDRPTGPHMSGVRRADCEEERLARLRLARSENVGPRTFAHLLRRYGSATAAVDALPGLAASGGRTSFVVAGADEAEAEMAAGDRAGACMLTIGDALYPPLLAQIDSAPPVLWVIGRISILCRPAIGVVGARNASALGLRTARRITTELGQMGQIIVSGLARGIDRQAHEAALKTGTIAVMAGGVDQVFPPENQDLAAAITEQGALVSECAMGIEPTSRHFPRRNRLISGLSRGVVLIEAAVRSGSLITARYALDQGRDVMACPGAPEDPRTGGCNQLIRDGAALIRTAADVIEALDAPQGLIPGLGEPSSTFLHDVEALDTASSALDALADLESEGTAGSDALVDQIVRLLGPHPVEIDDLARASGARLADLSLALLELDLAGEIELLPGGMVARPGTG